ncbi:MAG: hypothetical protein CMO55_16060 [Verrucomicrobiales bacterium]|nr:hypothetical protein [Verrucomicrobiales bacterium]
MRWFLLVPFFFLSACGLAEDDVISEEKATEVMNAFQGQRYGKVIELTEGLSEDSKWRRIRGIAFQRRGMDRFFEKGEVDGAIADFDAFLELYPEEDAHHWQRGLAYYYAEEYEKGKAQFERHQTVNTQDVENAAWHFLCSVRAPGGTIEKAREEFIDIQRDSRVPMKEVHALFAGKGTAEEVLAASKPDDDNVLSDAERNNLCYAHLYLGLYYEAVGDLEKSEEHIRKAAFEYSMEHPMGKVAQLHAKVRGISPVN